MKYILMYYLLNFCFDIFDDLMIYFNDDKKSYNIVVYLLITVY